MQPSSERECKNFTFMRKFDFYVLLLNINFIENVNFSIKKNITNTKNVNLTIKGRLATSWSKQTRWIIFNR